MGERFGFYTMMAILVMFLQAKFNMSSDKAGLIYSTFYFAIYALALLGGFIADRTQNYKGVVASGVVIMFVGYILLAIPGMGLPMAIIGLGTIALGNGLFKGNLQALVGQMYDAPEYSKLRDTAYSIFYMGINVGAIFAPNAARAVRTWHLGRNGFTYDAEMTGLCNKMIDGTLGDPAHFQQLADKVSGQPVADLAAFAQRYLDVFSTGYNYAFAIAAVAMLISLTCYMTFKRHLPERKKAGAEGASDAPVMSKGEEKQRLMALLMVFLVVIFFWMSFHQNGLTMTFFARDYTVKTVSAGWNLAFNIWSLLSIGVAAGGLFTLVKPSSSSRARMVGASLLAAGSILAYNFYRSFSANNPIEPETFQQFNAFFVVFLTPVVVSAFAWLRERQMEPSAPRKIGIGMVIAALGFVILVIGSLGLPSPASLAGQPSAERVAAHWLINSYLILTFAELFLSPMGLSFVSRVAPPRFQGLMQGCWLGATAIGNQLLFVGSSMWSRIEIWQVWAIFIVCCLLSASVVFILLKRLEAATK
ncbi:MAG: peptide MFS transporter, partial [Holophaga sp.]|nr:peptide MFS transporter [Holophaga sp.]